MTEHNGRTAARLFYDGQCRFCCQSARRLERILARRGFELRPLQSPDAPQWPGLTGRDALREMRLLLADGRNLGGADAVVEIARHIWWAWPLWLVSRVPGARAILRAIYRVIAANRHCIGGACKIPRRHASYDWLPLLLLPVTAISIRNAVPAWVFMWLMALAIFLGCKWLILRRQALLCAWNRLRSVRRTGLKQANENKPAQTPRRRRRRPHATFFELP